jgi:hypothetical protein
MPTPYPAIQHRIPIDRSAVVEAFPLHWVQERRGPGRPRDSACWTPIHKNSRPILKVVDRCPITVAKELFGLVAYSRMSLRTTSVMEITPTG